MPEEYDDPGWITDPHDEEPDPGAEDPEAYYHDTHEYISGYGYYDPNETSITSTNLLEVLNPLIVDTMFYAGEPVGIGHGSENPYIARAREQAFFDEYGSYFQVYDPFKENIAKSAATLAKEDVINKEKGGIEAIRRNSTGMRGGNDSKSLDTYLSMVSNSMSAEDIQESSERFGARTDWREDVFDRWTDLVEAGSFEGELYDGEPGTTGLEQAVDDLVENTVGMQMQQDSTTPGVTGPSHDDLGNVIVEGFEAVGDAIVDGATSAWDNHIGNNGIVGHTVDFVEDLWGEVEESCVLSTAAYKQGLINSDDLMKFVSWRLKTQSKEFLGNVKWLGYQIAFRPVSNMMLKSKWFAKFIKKLILNRWMEIIEGKKKNRITKFVVEYTGVLGYLFNYKKAIELGKRIKPKSILKAYKNTIIKYDGNDKAYKRFLKGLKDG